MRLDGRAGLFCWRQRRRRAAPSRGVAEFPVSRFPQGSLRVRARTGKLGSRCGPHALPGTPPLSLSLPMEGAARPLEGSSSSHSRRRPVPLGAPAVGARGSPARRAVSSACRLSLVAGQRHQRLHRTESAPDLRADKRQDKWQATSGTTSQRLRAGPRLGPERVTNDDQRRPTTTARPQVIGGGQPSDQRRRSGPSDPGQEVTAHASSPLPADDPRAGGSSLSRRTHPHPNPGVGRAAL